MNLIKKIYAWLKELITGKHLLAYEELCELIAIGVIGADIENVNGSSIDLTLHHIIYRESIGPELKTIRLYKGESISLEKINMLYSDGGEHIMMPDSIVLGATREIFEMPLNLSAEYSLKSTLGRNFLGHELAGWIDPGFSGTITLELKNNTQFHKLAIGPFMKIGQVKFFRHKRVPLLKSYKKRGQYNGQILATPAKGIK